MMLKAKCRWTGRGWLIEYRDTEDNQLAFTSETWPAHPRLALLGRQHRARVVGIARGVIGSYEAGIADWALAKLRRPHLVCVNGERVPARWSMGD